MLTIFGSLMLNTHTNYFFTHAKFSVGVLGWVALLGTSSLTQGSRFLPSCDTTIFTMRPPGLLWKGRQYEVDSLNHLGSECPIHFYSHSFSQS